MKTSTLASSLAIAATVWGCTGSALPPVAPTSATVVAAPSPARPTEPDRKPVPAPPSLVAVARVARPESSWRDIGAWSSGRLSLNGPFGRFADLVESSAPIDFAVSFRLRTLRMSVEPQLVASALLQDDRAVLQRAEQAGLSPLELGGGIVQLGDRESPACLLVPAVSPARFRLVCSDVAPDVMTAGYLARTLPTEDLGDADLVLEVRSGDIVERFAGLPPVRGWVLSEAEQATRRSLPQMSAALEPVLPALVDHAFELAAGTDKVRVELRQLDAGITELRTSFWPRGEGAWLWRAAAAQQKRETIAPEAFWRLAPMADAMWFSSRFEEDRYRELKNGLVDLFAGIFADTPAARDTADLVVRSMLPHGPVLHAHGDTTQRPEPEHGNPYVRARAVSFFGWHVVGVDFPASEVERDLSGGMDAYNDGRLDTLAHRAVPQLCSGLPRITRRKAPAAWPKGTTLFEMAFTSQFFEQCGGRRTSTRPTAAAKPLVVTVALVPDGARSWVGVSADDKQLEAVIQRLMSAAPGAPADRLLEPLSRVAVMSGGLLTDSAVEQTLGHVGGWSWNPWSAAGAGRTGDSTVAWYWRAPESAGAPVTLTARVPREGMPRWIGMLQSRRR